MNNQSKNGLNNTGSTLRGEGDNIVLSFKILNGYENIDSNMSFFLN